MKSKKVDPELERLVKIVNIVVEKKITKLLKTDTIKKIIKEEVKSQFIKILLENDIKPKPHKKNVSGLMDLMEESDNNDYPKLKTNKPVAIKKPNVRYTRDPLLNKMLNETPYVPDSNTGFTGNALMDMGGGLPANEPMNYATTIAKSVGKNVKIDIDSNKTTENIMPSNVQTFSSTKTPLLKEYKDPTDNMIYVDERGLFDDSEQITPQQVNIARGQEALVNAFSKDYRQLLQKTEEKSKLRRPNI